MPDQDQDVTRWWRIAQRMRSDDPAARAAAYEEALALGMSTPSVALQGAIISAFAERGTQVTFAPDPARLIQLA